MPVIVNRCAICKKPYWICDCATRHIRKLEQIKEGNRMSIPKRLTKKYYVGSSSVFNPGNTHLKATVDEAIEDAKQKLDETGEEQFVVQIIRIVRPVKPEVSVQKV